MAISLYDHQKKAVEELKSGSILCGGVGSGKSRTSIAYYFFKECQGSLKVNGKGDVGLMKKPKDLYIITTAKKRDSLEWVGECAPFLITTKPESSINGVKLTVDSWNNIGKYVNIKNSFFIFDEQRLVGSGTWVKSFLKITKSNNWILLSATPGDTWSDYIPVFIANKFYKNRTEFLQRHAVYSRFSKFPMIEKYIEINRLLKLRDEITVLMPYEKPTISHDKIIKVKYDINEYTKVMNKRWNPYLDQPIRTASELCYTLRKIVNSDDSRIYAIEDLIKKHPKVIIFYNFDYELEMLRMLGTSLHITTNQWNGHKHEEVPKGDSWIYLVQYTAGAEGWNCIDTDVIIFYSQNYSYKIMKQAAGRIDRLNTTFRDLYYYHLVSTSSIDIAITNSIKKKKNFNMMKFVDGGNKKWEDIE
jgi:hypothetical protein